ncbi:MAG: Uma2 family endonuclease [Chloroflexota bacterium]|nr:MAG: Uma2 family endonuclease [Chloroflexota bacterium]
MAARPQESYSPDEYLAMEQESDIRHEYFDGHIVAMSGASINHNQIVGNAAGELRNALRGKSCRVFSTDLKVGFASRRFYLYPDVLVVCGKLDVEPKRDDTVRNPTLIIEVLSRSTQSFDKSEKFELYRSIPSMQEYVMIDQKRVYVEHYRKKGRFWVMETLSDLKESLELASLGVTITVAVLYEQVQF